MRTYVKCAKDCKSTPRNSPKVKNCLVCVRNKQGGNGPVDETELDLCGHATPAQFLLCSYPNWIYIRLGSWNIKTCEYVSGTGECGKVIYRQSNFSAEQWDPEVRSEYKAHKCLGYRCVKMQHHVQPRRRLCVKAPLRTPPSQKLLGVRPKHAGRERSCGWDGTWLYRAFNTHDSQYGDVLWLLLRRVDGGRIGV